MRDPLLQQKHLVRSQLDTGGRRVEETAGSAMSGDATAGRAELGSAPCGAEGLFTVSALSEPLDHAITVT